MVNIERELEREAEEVVRGILDGLGGFSVSSRQGQSVGDIGCDVVIEAKSSEAEFRIALEVKKRITPQTAISLCERMQRLPDDLIPVIYAPVISPRVADIANEFGIGYVDRAGNCRLRSVGGRLLIDRRGYKSPSRSPKRIADPFSPKSSRIVRAMLSRPAEGWKVRELAEEPDIDVSVGLVSKVKRALVEEGYAVEHKRLLYLRDPVGLLENWAKKYPGPAEQIPMYFRGDAEAAEEAVGQWCRDSDIRYALAGFSAAWRIAPEVRHNVAAVYVHNRGFDREVFDKLSSFKGGKRVETGANLLLWRPFDRSVFADSEPPSQVEKPRTSALQTFLDVKRLAGRGEEAAVAIYEKHLGRQLQEAAQRVKELQHEEL